MKTSALVRIDRVLRKTMALIKAVTLTEDAEDACKKFWKHMESLSHLGGVKAGDSDAYFRFAQAYEDFRSERATIPAIVLDLKDIGYPYREGIEIRYTALEERPRDYTAVYEAVCKQRKEEMGAEAWDEAVGKAEAWVQKHEEETDWHPPGLLENLGEFKEVLVKARTWLKARKRRKRKPKDDAYVSLNATEAARFINTTAKTITTWIGEGTLHTYGRKIGTKYNFLQSELEAKKAAFKPRKSRKTDD